MNKNFKSDFSLIPIIKEGKSGWKYRPATWPSEIDPKVHLLFDNISDDDIDYSRHKLRNDMLQHCKIVKEGNNIIMKPGDGFNYNIKRISKNNKLTNMDEHIDNENIPHNMKCIICMTNKKTHAIIPCFHVVACSICASLLYDDNNKKCPLCNSPFNEPLKKLFF